MAKRGVVPTNNMYALLIDLYGKAGLAKEAVLLVKHMKIRAVFPDEVTMNTVFQVLKDAREYDRADKFYKNWCSGRLDLDSIVIYESETSLEPMSLKHFLSTELFRTGGRNQNQNNSEVFARLDPESSVKKLLLTPTYNTLIDLYGKAGRLNSAEEVFAEMVKSGVKVDTFTFNTKIFTCGSLGHLTEDEAYSVKWKRGESCPIQKLSTSFFLYMLMWVDSMKLVGVTIK